MEDQGKSDLRRLYEQAERFSSVHNQLRIVMATSFEKLPDGKIRFKRKPPFEAP